jgi:VWFA-related protein
MKNHAAVALLGCSALLAQAQQLSVPTLSTQTNVVLIPALVQDGKGALVFTLQASDFTVTDDGVPQALTLDEETGSEPLALVIAVETGGAGRDKLQSYRDLGTQLDAVVGGVQHVVAVVAFDGAPTVMQGFTPDVDAAAGALNRLEPGDKDAAVLDGLKFSIDLLRTAPRGYRRVVLLISETVDRTSQAKMDEVLQALSDTNTSIYSLAFASGKSAAANYAYHELPVAKTPDGPTLGDNQHPGPPHGCMGKDTDPEATQNKGEQAYDCLALLAPPLALAKMAAIRMADGLRRNVPETVADLTGGEYFKFEKSKEVVRDLLAMADHLPNRYVISFQPTAPHAGFHAVELKLKDHPGLRLTARSGYWVDESAVNSGPWTVDSGPWTVDSGQ